MAVLSNTDLRVALASEALTVELPEWLADLRGDDTPHIDPAGVGLHLGLTWRRQRVMADPIEPDHPRAAELYWEDEQEMATPGEGLVIRPGEPEVQADGSIVVGPGELILATTAEVIGLDARCAGKVYARSTTGRYGLEVCGCAGWVDPGFTGALTLELRVVGSSAVRLYAGQRIAQLVVLRCTSPADPPYEGQYQGQVVATVPGRW